MNKYLAKLIIAVVVVILNYITSKLLVFTKKKPAAKTEGADTEEKADE